LERPHSVTGPAPSMAFGGASVQGSYVRTVSKYSSKDTRTVQNNGRDLPLFLRRVIAEGGRAKTSLEHLCVQFAARSLHKCRRALQTLHKRPSNPQKGAVALLRALLTAYSAGATLHINGWRLACAVQPAPRVLLPYTLQARTSLNSTWR
jgi:hypothetical protein